MGNGVASKLRKSSRTMAGRLSRPFDFPRAANSRRLELFEPSVKCDVEFCFFLVCPCLSGASEISRAIKNYQVRRRKHGTDEPT